MATFIRLSISDGSELFFDIIFIYVILSYFATYA